MEDRSVLPEESEMVDFTGVVAEVANAKKRKAGTPVSKEVESRNVLSNMDVMLTNMRKDMHVLEEKFAGEDREMEEQVCALKKRRDEMMDKFKREMKEMQAKYQEGYNNFLAALEYFEDDGAGFETAKRKGKKVAAKGKTLTIEAVGGDAKKQVIKGWETAEDGTKNPIYEEVEERSVEDKVPMKTERIPPIDIVEVDKIGLVRDGLKENGVVADFKTAKGGVRIFPKSSEDFRLIVRKLKDWEVGAHWYMLKEEKPLQTVVKGIPLGLAEEEVKEDLVAKGFKVESVVRMKRDKANPYNMVAVTSERSEEGKRLFEINNVGGFRVKVESKRKPLVQAQCFRCQEFGHVQYRCTAKLACAFCAEEHRGSECPKPRGRGQPALCKNCGGNHPAFYLSCPKHPWQSAKRAAEEKAKKVQNAEVKQGVSYADRCRAAVSASGLGEKKGIPESSIRDKVEQILRWLPDIIGAING